MSTLSKSLFAFCVVCALSGLQSTRISTRMPRIGPEAHRSAFWKGLSEVLATGMMVSLVAGVVSVSEDARRDQEAKDRKQPKRS